MPPVSAWYSQAWPSTNPKFALANFDPFPELTKRWYQECARCPPGTYAPEPGPSILNEPVPYCGLVDTETGMCLAFWAGMTQCLPCGQSGQLPSQAPRYLCTKLNKTFCLVSVGFDFWFRDQAMPTRVVWLGMPTQFELDSEVDSRFSTCSSTTDAVSSS